MNLEFQKQFGKLATMTGQKKRIAKQKHIAKLILSAMVRTWKLLEQ